MVMNERQPKGSSGTRFGVRLGLAPVVCAALRPPATSFDASSVRDRHPSLTLSPRRGEGTRWPAMLGRADQVHGR